MMNANAKKWVEALRSGKYTQCTGKLSDTNNYCCLGVACEVAIQNGVKIREEILDDRKFGHPCKTYNGNSVSLPTAVIDWLELRSFDGSYHKRSMSLISKNDAGSSFAEIADIIESEPEGLFV